MKPIRFYCVALLALLALMAGAAIATPNVNSAVVVERLFNDCPASTVTTTDLYPASITISDQGSNCFGFANLHYWRFSEDNATVAEFANGDAFSFGFDLVIDGTGHGEAGLQIAPWWNNDEGRINVRTTDGEIACFGGRLPFYSFTGSHAVTYVKGTTIHLEIIYLPNDLTMANPATIEYKLTIGANDYTSGPLAFNEGNPAEDPPHGLWGILTPAKPGGHMQVLWQAGGPNTNLTTTWSNITFSDLSVAVEAKAWTQIKGLFR
jgi:hypothetical protein